MKVYNLTDVATPTLVSRSMVNVPIMVTPGVVVMPGQHVDVPAKLATRTYLEQTFGNIGAVAIDRLPDTYRPKPVAVPSVAVRRARRAEPVKPVEPADGSEG